MKKIFSILCVFCLFTQYWIGYANENISGFESEILDVPKSSVREIDLAGNYNGAVVADIDYDLGETHWDGDCNIPFIFCSGGGEFARVSIYSKDNMLLATRVEDGGITNTPLVARQGRIQAVLDFAQKKVIFRYYGSELKEEGILFYTPFRQGINTEDGLLKIKIGASGNPGIKVRVEVKNILDTLEYSSFRTKYNFETEQRDGLGIYADFINSTGAAEIVNDPQNIENKVLKIPAGATQNIVFLPRDKGFAGQVVIRQKIWIKAASNETSLPAIQEYITGSTQTLGKISVSDSRQMRFDGAAENRRISSDIRDFTQRWIKTECLIDTENAQAALYIDGIPAAYTALEAEAETAPLSIPTADIINKLVYYHGAGDIYIDDLEIVQYSAYTCASNLYTVDAARRRITGIAAHTAEAELTAGITLTNGASGSVKDANGNDVIGEVKTGDYLTITDQTGNFQERYILQVLPDNTIYQQDFEVWEPIHGITGGTLQECPGMRAGNSLKMDCQDKGTLDIYFPGVSGEICIDFDMYFTQNTVQRTMAVLDQEQNLVTKLYFENQETVGGLLGNTSVNYLTTSSDRQWDKYRIIIDTAQKKARIFINFRPLQTEGMALCNDYMGDGILRCIRITSAEGGETWIDNIRITPWIEPEEIQIVSAVYTVDNEFDMVTDIPYGTTTEEFLNEIDCAGKNGIVLDQHGRQKENGEVLVSGDSLWIEGHAYAIGLKSPLLTQQTQDAVYQIYSTATPKEIRNNMPYLSDDGIKKINKQNGKLYILQAELEKIIKIHTLVNSSYASALVGENEYPAIFENGQWYIEAEAVLPNYGYSLAAIAEDIYIVGDTAVQFTEKQKDWIKKQLQSGSMVRDTAAEIYVSAAADSNGRGTFESPFSALQEAVDAAENYRNQGRDAVIYIRGGAYTLCSPVQIRQNSDSTRLVIRNYPGEDVYILGGKAASMQDFTEITDQTVRQRLSENIRDKVKVLDLTALGITDFGEYLPAGWNIPFTLSESALYKNGLLQQNARYPNEGWLTSGQIITQDPKTYDRPGNAYGQFAYTDTRPEGWLEFEKARIWSHFDVMYGGHDIQLGSIDPTLKSISVAGKFYAAPTKPFDYYYFNVLEELDAPGEYYLDKDNARLYYYPDADIESARLVVSSLADSAILVEEAENITLDGLRIEGVRGTGIKIKNSRNIILQNVTVSGTGMAGVDIDGGMDNGLLGCEISNNGGDAVKLRGGDWFTLSPAGHYVCDSYLHNFSQRKKSYTAGVTVAGAGFTIQNNIIADAPHTGIFIRGNDVTIKNNILRDLVQDARDMGAIYSVDSYGWRGTQIYNNHFENIRNLKEDAPIGSVKCIYLDNFTSGYSIHHNLFLDSDHGIHLGGGRENRFYQNILCNTDYSIGAYNLKDATFTQAPFVQCDLMPAQCNLWKMKYPGIEEIRTVNPGYPNQTEIGDNIIIGAEKTVITDNAHMILRDNHFLSGDAVDENIKVKDKKIYESLIQPVEPDYAVIGRYVSECRERTAKRLYAFTDRCSLLSPYLYIPQGTSCVLHIIGEDEKGRWAIDDAEISTSNENIIAVEGKRLAAKGDGAATITISAGEQISQVQVITGIYRLHVENGM